MPCLNITNQNAQWGIPGSLSTSGRYDYPCKTDNIVSSAVKLKQYISHHSSASKLCFKYGRKL